LPNLVELLDDSQSLSARLIVSGREGFGSGCAAIQASRAATLAGMTRTIIGVASVGGRPRPRFFSISPIDLAMV